MTRFAIRQATGSDLDSIFTFDHLAREDARHRAFVERSVRAGHCFVVETRDQVIGYGVFEHSFYQHGFVSMLYIAPDLRRQGAGSMLMRHFESICQTDRLFTSTNLSNLPTQSLLAKLGYTLSGVIHHLDRNDPELVYVKFLRQDGS